jgi:hypothetical protein
MRRFMEDELTPEQKFNAESVEAMVPRALLEGRSYESIIADLIRLDWTREHAQALIERASAEIRQHRASPESRAELVQACRRQMVTGFIMVILGLIITVVTFLAAAGGMAPVWICAYGLIIVGLVFASRGYTRWRLYRGDVLSHVPGGGAAPPRKDAS